MNKQPKISIIIPVYNVEEYITECIQSVMHQTYKGEVECVLVDDCGNDNSIAVAEQLIAGYKGTIVFRILHHDHNRGLSAARNTGAEVATGEYIYFLDSDDYISDDCIDKLAKPLFQRDYDVVMGDIQTFGVDDKEIKYSYDEVDEIVGNEAIFSAYAARSLYVMACNKLCKRSFLYDNNITFLEGQLHEDELWTYKAMLHTHSISLVHQITYNYRVRAFSITSSTNVSYCKKSLSYFVTIKYMYDHPYHDQASYNRVTDFYVPLYMGFAIASHHISLKQYLLVRKMYSPNNISQRKISIRLHYSMPPIIGYVYLVIWMRLKSLIINK